MASRIVLKKSKESGQGPNPEVRNANERASHKLSGPEANEHQIATIVEYTDEKPPRNQYPQRIVSPVRSGPCCFTDMEEIGKPQEDGRWVFQYKRCRKCGFALRVILREIPDAALAAELRKILANSFVRNVPE